MSSYLILTFLLGHCIADPALQKMLQDALQRATQEAQQMARYQMEVDVEDEILSRSSRFSRSDLCVAQKHR